MHKTPKRFSCNKCGYKWISKKVWGDPKECPRCKSDKINMEEDLIEDGEAGSFCDGCGRKLTLKNLKGKCTMCDGIICNSCGRFSSNKLVCVDCE